MSTKSTSSRRTFLKGGAFAAAPLAVGVPAAALADSGLGARMTRLEDEAAIRDLHQAWLGRINGGAPDERLGEQLRSIVAAPEGEADVIEVAADGQSATGRFHCVVEIERPLARDCTLAEMAHAQGSGRPCHSARRVLTTAYRKTKTGWNLEKAALV